MTITLKDLKHLEVMGTLENTAPRKAPEINIKELIADKTNREPTLNEKIVSLCTKLRSDGFEKQAESLESKFLAYKAASTHLYRAHDEDGEDLVDFAHPDGAVKVEDAAKDLGHVETVVTRHKKIVDVVNKTPTGKLASKYSDALKYITAQNVDELSNVNLQEISKKFQYMADYLKKYFTSNMPEGSTLEPSARNFYGLLDNWQALAQTIATELNHDQVMPITQAMQLVKNRLHNGFSNAQQYVTKVNHVSDVDKLVSWILSWAEENNPMKKSAGLDLNKYVAACKTVLEKQAILPHLIVWVWSKTDRFNQGIEKNTDILISEINDIKDKAEITRSHDGVSTLTRVTGHLADLKTYTETFKKISTSPKEQDLDFLRAYGKFIVKTIEPELRDLDAMMRRIRKEDEAPLASDIYRTFIASAFEDVQKAIRGLWHALLDMTKTIKECLTEVKNRKIREQQQQEGDPVLKNYDPNADPEESAEEGSEAPQAPAGTTNTRKPVTVRDPSNSLVNSNISKLSDLINAIPGKKIPESKKQKAIAWANAQISELLNAGTDEAKIKKLVEQVTEFERQLKVLEGRS